MLKSRFPEVPGPDSSDIGAQRQFINLAGFRRPFFLHPLDGGFSSLN